MLMTERVIDEEISILGIGISSETNENKGDSLNGHHKNNHIVKQCFMNL